MLARTLFQIGRRPKFTSGGPRRLWNRPIHQVGYGLPDDEEMCRPARPFLLPLSSCCTSVNKLRFFELFTCLLTLPCATFDIIIRVQYCCFAIARAGLGKTMIPASLVKKSFYRNTQMNEYISRWFSHCNGVSCLFIAARRNSRRQSQQLVLNSLNTKLAGASNLEYISLFYN